MAEVRIRVDHDADAAYIRLSNETVANTVELTDDVLVDLDAMDVAVGIELLSLDAEIPFSELEKHCHLHSSVISRVRKIQPSIRGLVRLYVGSDALTSASADNRHLTDA